MTAEQLKTSILEKEFSTASDFRNSGTPWRLFVFSSFAFSLTVLVFLGFKFGYGAYLEVRSKKLDQEMQRLAETVSQSAQDNFVNFYAQLINIGTILKEHKFTSNIFSFLEKNTIAEVYYKDVQFSLSGNKLKLNGSAGEIRDLIAQLSLFDAAPELTLVKLDSVSIKSGSTDFSLTLEFNPLVFEKIY